ncbi:MAG: DUF3822 family protein [Bacteroidia bacterium]
MISDIGQNLKTLHSVIDESFDGKKAISYNLIMQVSVSEVQLAVNERSKNKFIALERYALENTYNFDLAAGLFEKLFGESKLTSHKYHHVTCCIAHELSTLVPSPLFEEDRKRMYLKFNSSLEGNELILVDEIRSLDAKNVFALPFSVKAKLDSQFPGIVYHHASSPLINSIVAENKNKDGKRMFVHVQGSHFEVVVIDNRSLLFYNTFKHFSPEDFIYYLLFVCEQLQLNPETIDTYLLGEVDKGTPIHTVAHKYIRKLKFAERNDAADYCYQLQTLPRHSYYTLFNSYFS